jgi:hypothetical protein
MCDSFSKSSGNAALLIISIEMDRFSTMTFRPPHHFRQVTKRMLFAFQMDAEVENVPLAGQGRDTGGEN